MPRNSDVLNLSIRIDAAKSIYNYVQTTSPTRKDVLDMFSVGTQTALTENILDFLEAIELLGGAEKLSAAEPAETEVDFLVLVIGRIHRSKSESVHYVSTIWRKIFSQGSRTDEGLDNSGLLAILRDVRRALELGRGESAGDTGKLEMLKPLLTELGLVARVGNSQDLVYYPYLDPKILCKLLQVYSVDHSQIQAYDFVAWCDDQYLPALDDTANPFTAIKLSLEAAERMSMIKLTSPSDYRKSFQIDGRDVSKVEIIP